MAPHRGHISNFCGLPVAGGPGSLRADSGTGRSVPHDGVPALDRRPLFPIKPVIQALSVAKSRLAPTGLPALVASQIQSD